MAVESEWQKVQRTIAVIIISVIPA